MPADLSYCAQQVRGSDPDRFLTGLFAPATRREALFTLYAFNIELARIRENVTEPMMGRIRLQWWREAIADLYEGRVRGHQVLQAMEATALPTTIDQALLQEMIDARELDLDEEPPVSDIAVKQYARSTGGALMKAAAILLGVRDEVALAAALTIGEAVTLTGLLRSIPYHAAHGRSYIPSTLLRKLNLDARAPHARPFGIEVVTMLMAHEAERLLHETPVDVPRDALAAYLPGRLALRYLKRLARMDFDPYRPENLAPSPFKPLDLAWAWMTRAA